jgi:hypothetical protein
MLAGNSMRCANAALIVSAVDMIDENRHTFRAVEAASVWSSVRMVSRTSSAK